MNESALTTEEGLRALLAASPFHRFMPIEIVKSDREAGRLSLKLPFKADFERQPGSGQHHGGVIATLVDVSGAFAMIAATGRNVPTRSLSIDYLRPALQSSDLFAESQVRQVGRTVGLVDIEISDPQGRLIAVGRASLNTAAAE